VTSFSWKDQRYSLASPDVKDFGEIIDDGPAALVIVGESKPQQAVEKAGLKAEKRAASPWCRLPQLHVVEDCLHRGTRDTANGDHVGAIGHLSEPHHPS
jgi:hypothetical protein